MKKIIVLLSALCLCICLCSCTVGNDNAHDIPDVFGVYYTDAISILEADGFEVNAIEASVGSFSEKLLYPLEKVDKGIVFKIDEYIIDEFGELNKNYDVFYDGGLVSEDKSVVIYYAKEDYVLEKNETPSTTPPSTEGTTEPPTEATTPPTTEGEKKDSTDNGIDPDFKAAMDSYEAFMCEYVEFMKRYKENPSDLALFTDYANYMSKYAQFVEDFEEWEDEDLNNEEMAYYVDVQARVTKKLLEVA